LALDQTEKDDMDFKAKWSEGLSYADFLKRYASPDQLRRWEAVYSEIVLTPAQKGLLNGFQREMMVAVVSGAWCGDCVQQCPIFEAFAKESPRLQIRYFDRDDHGDLADALSICGGRRVPSVLFMAEDGAPCGRYGDRTLAKYRDSAASLSGAACPTGLVAPAASLQSAVIQEWLDQFERVQLMLRLSPRLRQIHGD
jgi:thiol-disulfide isomerase/thioredoxin